MEGAETLHASAVAIGGSGLLILGATGSGKSALALALIARGAELVADDWVEVRPGATPEDLPILSPPPAIAGLIEARGIGLVRLPFRAQVEVALVADLDHEPPCRLPPLESHRLQGRTLPLLKCRDLPGLADALCVLLGHGRLVDPDRSAAPG